jgi:Sulfatase
MNRKILTQPFYVLLLPVFFVTHGILENFGFIGINDAIVLCLTYLLAAIVLVAFFYLFFRSLSKATLATTLCMGIFLLFGAVQDFLRTNTPIPALSKYSFLLPALGILLAISFFCLKRTNSPLHRLTKLLNLLLAIYLLVDLSWIVIKAISPDQDKLSVYNFDDKHHYKTCDTCSRPDIYFLLFDEYGSSLSLKERYHFENDLDQFLQTKGFSIQTLSKSNYNFTPFSMASILNMSYLQGIKNAEAITVEDYARCNSLIRNNEVIRLLDAEGYEIINYSIFDLAGHPSMVKQSFLPLKTKLITDRTLFPRIKKDMGWLLAKTFPFSLFMKKDILKTRNNNNRFINLVKQSVSVKSPRPRFIYTHLYMPHKPFYYDKAGNERNTDQLYKESNADMSPATYLGYLTYANSRIRELISTIQQGNPAAAIIVMGDHGFRLNDMPGTSGYLFTNFNAVYLPGQKQDLLYPAITGVNQFRVIFNQLFHQSLPLLKDSCILLYDKH